MITLGAYRLALDVLLGGALKAISRLILSTYDAGDRDRSISVLTPAVTEVVRAYRREAHSLATRLIESQAQEQGVDVPPYIPAQSGYSSDSVQAILKERLRGSPDEAAQDVSTALGQHVEDSARQTVIRSVEDGRASPTKSDRAHRSRDALSPAQFKPIEERRADLYRQLKGLDGVDRSLRESRAKSWARMLTPTEATCAFCTMLASRGPVYSSAEDAGRVNASEYWGDDAKGYANSYHENCRCVIVPIFSFKNWPGRQEWHELEKIYRRAQDNVDLDRIRTPNVAIGAMRQELERMKDSSEAFPKLSIAA